MSHAPSSALEHRHRAIRQAMAERALDALVVTSLPNVLYLTNFTGSSAILVVTPDDIQFLTDSRYLTVVADTRGTSHECPGLNVRPVPHSYDEALLTSLTGLAAAQGGRRRVGFDAANVSVARHRWLEGRLGDVAVDLVAAEGIVEQARLRKDVYEQSVLREAARRLSEVTVAVFGEIRAGRQEREIAAAIDGRLRAAGFERPAFDTIVASGPNSALPHARPGERILSEGDLVVLDFGGVYDSYCVDLTRTVVVGRASERAETAYRAVRLAHGLAIAAVRPGVMPHAIDAAARDALAERGMAEAFGHGTGHGLGIEVHEAPRVSRRLSASTDATGGVAPGMVFTIEPGVYFPGWGGVRIEDDVLVTEDGVEVLTNVTTELLEL